MKLFLQQGVDGLEPRLASIRQRLRGMIFRLCAWPRCGHCAYRAICNKIPLFPCSRNIIAAFRTHIAYIRNGFPFSCLALTKAAILHPAFAAGTPVDRHRTDLDRTKRRDLILVTVHLPDGTSHQLEALEGWRVMEVIRDWGLPIKADCGGACACATCHVKVKTEWLDRLAPQSDEELEMLDGAFDVDDRSRLCCQIIVTPELNGLELELEPDSLTERSARSGWEARTC